MLKQSEMGIYDLALIRKEPEDEEKRRRQQGTMALRILMDFATGTMFRSEVEIVIHQMMRTFSSFFS